MSLPCSQQLLQRVLTTSSTVAIHQANYARILALRQTAEALDEQVKSTLSLLAATRKELLETPATVVPASSRAVPFDELLQYAKKISTTSRPPHRHPGPPVLEKPAKDEQEADGDADMANGIDATELVADEAEQPSKPVSKSETVLSDAQKAWLDVSSKVEWVPWPQTDKIRSGALADIQRLLDQGRDPSTVLSPEEQEAEDKRRAEDEERRKKEEEELDRQRRERAHATAVAAHGRQEQAAAALDFDLYNPEEDDM